MQKERRKIKPIVAIAIALAVLFPLTVIFSYIGLWKSSKEAEARRFVEENFGVRLNDMFEFADSTWFTTSVRYTEGDSGSEKEEGCAYLYGFKETSNKAQEFMEENFLDGEGNAIQRLYAHDDFELMQYLWIDYYGNSDSVIERQTVSSHLDKRYKIVDDRFYVYDFGATEKWSKRVVFTYHRDFYDDNVLFLAEERPFGAT